MADTFFIRFRGRTVGPYTLADVRQMARKGKLSRTSEVSIDGQAWGKAASYPEIFEKPSTATVAASLDPVLSFDPEPTPPASSGFVPFEVPKTPSLNEWYYTSGNEQKGPTSASNIVAMIKSGTLASHDRVWREGLDNWVSIGDVPEFAAAIGSTLASSVSVRGGAAEGVFCRECGARINRKAVICTQCGVPQQPETGGSFSFAPPAQQGPRAPRVTSQAQDNSLIAAGYTCAAVSFFVCPIVFSLIAFIIGIINLTRNQIGHGIAQIVLSILCPIVGTIVGHMIGAALAAAI